MAQEVRTATIRIQGYSKALTPSSFLAFTFSSSLLYRFTSELDCRRVTWDMT
eukprot:COSAG01_NODE_171_length_23132_cov_53.865118_3_plen_52_part_00